MKLGRIGKSGPMSWPNDTNLWQVKLRLMPDNKALIAREGGCRRHVRLINGPESTLGYSKHYIHKNYTA